MSRHWAELSRALDSPPKKSNQNKKRPQETTKTQQVTKKHPQTLWCPFYSLKPKLSKWKCTWSSEIHVHLCWERIAVTCYFPPCCLLAVLEVAEHPSSFDTARFIIKMHAILTILVGSFSPVKTHGSKFLVVHKKISRQCYKIRQVSASFAWWCLEVSSEI